MTLLWALLGFVVTIGIIVAVHEAGHLLAAKALNVKVERFSIGFGPILCKKQWGETEYAISLVPLGGYVQMTGENGSHKPENEEDRLRSYDAQPKHKRAIILAAGPFMNFILAFVCYVILGAVGIPDLPTRLAAPPAQSAVAEAGLKRGDVVTEVEGTEIRGFTDLNLALVSNAGESDVSVRVDRDGTPFETSLNLSNRSFSEAISSVLAVQLGFRPEATGPVVIVEVFPDGPAAHAGMLSGDKVLSINGKTGIGPEEFREAVLASGDRPLQMVVANLKDDKERTITVTPVAMSLAEGEPPLPAIAVSLGQLPEFVEVTYGPLEAIPMGVRKVWDMVRLQAKGLGQIARGEGTDQISGPVGIADMAGQAARSGLRTLLDFVALVSVCVGFINLVPVPGLDGGHLFVMGLEVLRRRDFAMATKEKLQKGGLIAVLLLMAFAINNDITRIFG